MGRTAALAIALGAAALLFVLNTMAVNATAYPAISCAIVAFVAGWVVRRRGAVIGFLCVLGAALLWFAQVLVRAWLQGDLARTFPDCDPCGLTGYAIRMTIVTAMGLVTFGVVGAIAGWLGAFARQRGFASPQRS